MAEPTSSKTNALSCAYVGQYHLEQFRRDLEELERAGIGRVYLPLTEEDMVLRRSNVLAMSNLARDRGLEAWLVPWGVGGVFSGPHGSSFVARHLDARQIDSAGESLPAACPNNPRFAYFMETWVQAAAECGAQGILLDEPAWVRHATLPEYQGMETAELWTCRCEHCQRRFQALHRAAALPEDLDAEVRDFRARTMAAFLREVGDSAWRRGIPCGLKISRQGSVTTWEILARQVWCREVSLSAFWPLAHQMSRPELDFGPSEEGNGTADARMQEFERQIAAGWDLLQRLRTLAQGRAFFWLRCFLVPQADEPMIPVVIEKLRALGIDDFAIWSFGGTPSLGALACERPEEVWQATLKALKQYNP